jgi:integrase
MNTPTLATVTTDITRAARLFDSLDVSESTRLDHQWRIGAFFQFLQGRPLAADSYLEFKRYLAARADLSISTKNKYLVSARVFLRELTRRGLLDRDLTLNVRLFQQSKKHKREGVTAEEMDRLAAYLRELAPTAATLRLRALVLLLGLQGLRQIEVRRLDVDDLDLVARTALVRGKGRDDKEPVDLHPQTVAAVKAYLAAAHLASGPLLPDLHHRHGADRITVRAIHKLVSKAFRAAGIDKTPHGLRHYFTTRLLEQYRGDTLEVRRYTRHAGTEMLQIYDDRRRQQADLPRFYDAFRGVAL